jgi:hypothetical protein
MNAITEEFNLINRLHTQAKHHGVAVVLRGAIDSYILFKDGQKLSFCPKTVDEQQLYVSINTYNRIIEAHDNHGVTTS